jgi:hypothetical protein
VVGVGVTTGGGRVGPRLSAASPNEKVTISEPIVTQFVTVDRRTPKSLFRDLLRFMGVPLILEGRHPKYLSYAGIASRRKDADDSWTQRPFVFFFFWDLESTSRSATHDRSRRTPFEPTSSELKREDERTAKWA